MVVTQTSFRQSRVQVQEQEHNRTNGVLLLLLLLARRISLVLELVMERGGLLDKMWTRPGRQKVHLLVVGVVERSVSWSSRKWKESVIRQRLTNAGCTHLRHADPLVLRWCTMGTSERILSFPQHTQTETPRPVSSVRLTNGMHRTSY